MIQDHFHPLDKVGAFGCTEHGLIVRDEGVYKRQVGGAYWPLADDYMESIFDSNSAASPEDVGDTHLLKVPGIAELEMTPDVLAAEAASGRQWQNYALLSGQRAGLFGHALGGWVHIDELGGRWLIKPVAYTPSPWGGYLQAGSVANLQFTVVPFGYLDEPAIAPVIVDATLDDIGQTPPAGAAAFAGPVQAGTSLKMRVASISSTGRKVIIALFPTFSVPADRRDLPYGWLMLTVSGAGAQTTITMSVVKSLTQALGAFREEATNTLVGGRWVKPKWGVSVTQLMRDGEGKITYGAATVSPTGYEIEQGAPGFSFGFTFSSGDSSVLREVIGRTVALVFDDADNLVEFSADWESSRTSTIPPPTVSLSGSWDVEGNGPTGTARSGVVRVGLAFTSLLEEVTTIRLRRNGEVLQQWTATASNTGADGETYEITAAAYGGSVVVDFETATGGLEARVGQPGGVYPAAYPVRMASWAWENKGRIGGVVLDSQAGSIFQGYMIPTAWAWHRVAATIDHREGNRYSFYFIQRLCNSVLAGRYERSIGATGSPVYAKSPAFFAPQAQLDNPSADSDALSRVLLRGSYNPATHDIHVTADTRARFGVWV